MEELLRAKAEFEGVLNSLTDDEKKEISPSMLEHAQALDVIVLAKEGDYDRFDQTVNILPHKYLYSEELIPTIYRTYVKRDMLEFGYKYLNEAYSYLKENDKDIPEKLEVLREASVNDKLIEKLRLVLNELRNLPHNDIPKVIPAILNGNKKIIDFILGEIISGLKIMRSKIKAVTSIAHENNFNDVFVATLRLRLDVWGWSIHDQERTGRSVSGRDAGEADVLIKAGANNIAIVEALKMAGGDFPRFEEHILKAPDYVRDLKHYFIVVYYHGRRANFNAFLNTYKNDIARINFPADWSYENATGYVDLKGKFNNVENFHIGKTMHGTERYELYHIIIDLSEA